MNTKFKQTETPLRLIRQGYEGQVGETPEDWTVAKLGDIIEKVIDNRGKTPPISTEGHELLEVNAILEEKKFPDFTVVRKYVNDDTYNSWFRGHIKKKDILIPTVGTIGNVAIMNESRGIIAQNLIGLRAKDQIDPDYLFYFLSSPSTKNILLNLDIGGVQPSIKVPHLLNITVTFPIKGEQEQIASILSSLDDKIELNRKMNKTLEDMAKALFKHWFVDFNFPINSPSEKGWQAKPDGVVDARNTQNYMSLPYNPALKDRARELRKAGNLAEVIFWNNVKSKQFLGLDFDRQKIIGNYIVDFYCASLNLVVEIDGLSHDGKQKYDAERDSYLKSLGLNVVHIIDSDVKKDIGGVMDELEAKIQPPRPAVTPPTEGNVGYKDAGGEMVESELGMIPKGWEIDTLDKIITFNPPEGLKKGQMAKHLDMKGLSESGMWCYTDWKRAYSGGSKFRNGDSLMARITPCLENGKSGFVNFLADDEIGYGSTEYVVLRPTMLDYCEYVYLLVRSENFRGIAIKSMVGSSGRQRVQMNTLTAYKVAIPSTEIIAKLHSSLLPIFQKVRDNSLEVNSLTLIRDSLLPKLMGGRIRV